MAEILLGRSLPKAKKKSKFGLFFYIGLILLLLFPLQALIGWQPARLAELQQIDKYKMWSGLVLAIYLGMQWVLPGLRLAKKPKLVKRFYTLHKQVGVFAPLMFYMHSMQWGYAYLMVLSIVFFANIAIGLFSVDVVGQYMKVYRKQYTFWWMVMHVSLSVVTMGMMLYHIYISFAYQ